MTTTKKKLKILCLHGGQQSGEIMKQKIASSRKKLGRYFELFFLDAPFEWKREQEEDRPEEQQQPEGRQEQQQQPLQKQYNWWPRGDDDHKIGECFRYVLEKTKDERYDAIIGFSQGGLLATALVCRGGFPTVKALVTAGAPYRNKPFEVSVPGLLDDYTTNNEIPKLHFSGETDTMIPIESTQRLSDRGGNGRVVIHDKGHMFPAKAAYKNEMIDFLKSSLDII